MLTTHAQKRLQQRGISIKQIDAILLYGEEKEVNNATSYFNTKASEHEMLSDGFNPNFVDLCRGLYVICKDSLVLTTCHKYK